jgi:hypothetical protein
VAATPANFFKPRVFQDNATSFPDRTRNLANRYLNLCYENFLPKTLLDFIRRCRFKKQLQGFAQIVARFFDGFTLTCYIEFRT